MSCCGKKREQVQTAQANSVRANTPIPGMPGMRHAAPAPVSFEYVGQTGLTVRGPTGRATGLMLKGRSPWTRDAPALPCPICGGSESGIALIPRWSRQHGQ
jgi:hypothetical protein